MQELVRCRDIDVLKPEGTRRVGKSQVRWLDSVEEDLKKMGVRYWRPTQVAGPRAVEGNCGRG
jgi:hypothetical protein